jgi:hypothetical protein
MQSESSVDSSRNTIPSGGSLGFETPYDRLMGRHREIFHARDTKLEAARARRKAVREQKALAA